MNRMVQMSKFLSLVLRHAPEKIGLSLDRGGWADVDTLLNCANSGGVALDRITLIEIVASSDKQRFVLSDDGKRIRANQGHSVSVDLELLPQVPPSRLYHGTASRFLESIRREGLRPMERQHVHLSTDEATAQTVGKRHGHASILGIDAQAMHEGGHLFFCSKNGVWLTESVPATFISFPELE